MKRALAIKQAETPTQIGLGTFKNTSTASISDAETKLLKFLDNLKNLDADWDGEFLKPDLEAISDAMSFVRQLFKLNPSTKIEQACPGAMGEIVIELRKNEKSVEFIFYPNKKWKYVSVGGERLPEQGIFELKNLSNIIIWLNDEA